MSGTSPASADRGEDPRSDAMTDAARVTRPHPAWSGHDLDPAQRPALRSMTAEAVAREGVARTRMRLEVLGRERASGRWLDWESELRDRGAAIRRETLSDLDGYLESIGVGHGLREKVRASLAA